ncbi:MAG: TolC family outer membrane protein [Magnetococcales bacterium]|nr:TolC family outer membrane protein [Magnetococcales bacterium]MBF0114541.1 TolC family outer membrane protein [Magnetococcales bacterium]
MKLTGKRMAGPTRAGVSTLGVGVAAFIFFVMGMTTLRAETVVGTTPFAQALDAAMQSNPKIAAARATLLATKEKFDQSLASLLPEVVGGASHTRFSDTWTDNTSSSNPPDRLYVNMVQPLFRRQLLLTLQQSKPLIAAAEEEYQATVQAVLWESIQAMVNVLLTSNVARLAEENLLLTEHNLQAALARRQAGDLTKTDVDQATARVASAEAELIRARNEAVVSRARFEEATGMPVPDKLEVPDVPSSFIRGTLEALTAQREARPDLKAARLRMESAEVGVEIEKAGHYPMLDLQAMALTYRGGSDARINGENQYSVAVQLTVPLFSGGKVMSRTREALETKNAREADWQKVDKQALREIKQAHLMMNSAKATVSSSEAAYSFYKQAVKGMEEEFAAGFRTVIQLLELQNQLFRSETDLVKTRYELVSSQYQLLQTIGQLTPERMALPDWQEYGGSEGAEAGKESFLERLLRSLQSFPGLDAALEGEAKVQAVGKVQPRAAVLDQVTLQWSQHLQTEGSASENVVVGESGAAIVLPWADVGLRPSRRLRLH